MIGNPRKINRSFFVVIGLILILGIFFRFYNLDKKTYWHDEAYTSIRVAGYNGDVVVKNVFQGEVISPDDLLKYQKVTPEIDWRVALDRFIEHPEHPPLYYLGSRFWQEIFGSSVTSSRAFSAVLSLLVFPAIFWLCWELFRSTTVGWIAVAMVAISPFHIIYAQEARQYSLWAATVLLSSASLVRAIQYKKIQWWVIYAVNLALNFYTVIISALVGIAHGVYVVVNEKFRPTKTLIAFILSGIGSLILFAPWIAVMLKNSYDLVDKTDWTSINRLFIDLLASWELHLNSIFIDLHPAVGLALAPRITPIILFFVGYTIHFLIKTKPLKIWFFLVSLIFIPALALILPDLISGGQKSIMTRYFVPSIVGIQIVVAYWLGTAKYRYNSIKMLVVFILVVSGIVSATVSSQTPTWWNKVVGYHNPEIAALVNQYDRPLLISNNHDINTGSLVSLAYLLDPEVRLLLTEKPNVPTIPEGNFSEVLIWNTGESFAEEFKQKNNCSLEIVGSDYYPPLYLVTDKENKQ